MDEFFFRFLKESWKSILAMLLISAVGSIVFFGTLLKLLKATGILQ